MKKTKDPQPENISSEWKARLLRMKKYQDESSTDWPTNERLLYGDTTGIAAEGLPTGVGGKGRGLAYAWGIAGGLLSRVYTQNPRCIAEPLSPALYETGRILTRIVQSDLESMEAETCMQQAIVDTLPFGYGAIIEAVENYMSSHTDPESGEEAVSLDGQDFNLRRIYPFDILFDPNGRRLDLSDHRYNGIRFYPTINWLREFAKANKFQLPNDLDEFPESAPEMKSGSTLERTLGPMGVAPHSEKEPGYRQIAVWEMWDRLSKKVTYITDHNDFEMGCIPWPVKLKIGPRDMFPTTLVAFHRRSTGFYPTPELSFIRPQLVELGYLDSLMRKDSGQKHRKIATLAEFVDNTQKAQIVDMSMENCLLTLDRKAVEEFFGEQTAGKDFDIGRVIKVLDDIQVNRDHPMRYAMIEQQINHIIGYGPSDRGGMPKVRSAREAVYIADSMEEKLEIRKGAVEKAIRDICAKHVIFLQNLQETTRYARNFPEVAEMAPFFGYTKDQIQGEFAFRVYAGSSTPLNTDARKAQTREMFQLMAPVLQQAGIDLRPLVEMVAKAHGWDEVDQLFLNVRGELKALAATLFAVNAGQADKSLLLEACARVVQVGLSKGELQMLAQQMAQDQAGGPPGQVPAATPGGMRGDPDAMGTEQGVI